MNRKKSVFEENCGDDSNFISIVATISSYLVFTLITNLLSSEIACWFILFIIRIVGFGLLAILMGRYYYYEKFKDVKS